MLVACFHTVINYTAFDLITHKSHSTQEMWQGLCGKCHLCAWPEYPRESPPQPFLFPFVWNFISLILYCDNSSRCQNRQEQSSKPGSFFSGLQWSFSADVSALEVSVNSQASFISLPPFYCFRGWEAVRTQTASESSQEHRVFRPCSSTQDCNLQAETRIGSVYAKPSCGKVMRKYFGRDPQTLRLFRISFVSCSELDCFMSWR